MNTSMRPQEGHALSPADERPSPREDVIDLRAVLRSFWVGKPIIVASILLATCLGVYYAYFEATPIYKSTAVVMLNNREEQVVDLESVLGGLSSDTSVVNTEVEILRSRSLLRKVVSELDLTSDPEFNPALRNVEPLDLLKSEIKAWMGMAGTDSPPTPEERQMYQRQATTDALLKAIAIRNIPQSLVFQVTVSTSSASKSARIADTLINLYIRDQVEVKFDATEQATSWLSERVAELQSELEVAEANVKDFRANTDLVSPETLEALERQVKDLRSRFDEMTISKKSAEQRLSALEQAETPTERVEATGGDSQLRSLLAAGGSLERFNLRFETLLTRAAQELQRSSTQLTALKNSLDTLEAQIRSQSDDLITLQQLTREAEASRLLYEYFLTRLKETAAQQGIQQADSRILSAAIVPTAPTSPKKAMILIFSGLLGLIVGLVIVLIREALNSGFRTAHSLEIVTGYSVLGQIPTLPGRNRKSAITYLAEKPTSIAAEAVRNLRTSLLLSNIDHPAQVIMTSSSLPGEGKTTTALGLAQNLSQMGRKVLVIEGDVRRRIMKQYVKSAASNGMLAVLSGTARLEDTLVRYDQIGVDILLGEEATVNAADIFSSEAFRGMLEQARQHYDHIIIDTPPVLLVPDARIIAQHVDVTLLVVRWDHTSRAQVLSALDMFESVNHSVTGLVLNNINLRGLKRYGYGNYGAYTNYGSRYYTN